MWNTQCIKESAYIKTKHNKIDLLEQTPYVFSPLLLGTALGFSNRALYASKSITFLPRHKPEQLI